MLLAVSKALVQADHALMDKLTQADDIDINQWFHEEKTCRSPTDKDRRRTEHIEAEEMYVKVRITLSFFIFMWQCKLL